MNNRGFEDLPAPDLSHILKYLSWEDKHSLRLVSNYFACNIKAAKTWRIRIDMHNFNPYMDLLRQAKINKEFDTLIITVFDSGMNKEAKKEIQEEFKNEQPARMTRISSVKWPKMKAQSSPGIALRENMTSSLVFAFI